MDDLVKRLRPDGVPIPTICLEAADRIEALEKIIIDLKIDVHGCYFNGEETDYSDLSEAGREAVQEIESAANDQGRTP